MAKTQDEYIRELVKAFEARNPEILMSVNLREGSYIFKLDYSFTEHDADVQKRAREDLNTLMGAVKGGLGASAWIELGHV